jgi:hypothetical protein
MDGPESECGLQLGTETRAHTQLAMRPATSTRSIEKGAEAGIRSTHFQLDRLL